MKQDYGILIIHSRLHYDVEIEFTLYIPKNDGSNKHVIETQSVTLEKIYMGKFPIMIQSDLCILNGMAPQVRKNMGEDPNDPGGYFIIDGKEKVIVSQEKFADNVLLIQKDINDMVSFSAKIRSVSEDASKPMRTSSCENDKRTTNVFKWSISCFYSKCKKTRAIIYCNESIGRYIR